MQLGSYSYIIIYILIPLITSIGTYAMRNLLDRLSVIESKLNTKISEETVRQIISDNIDPIREDIKEINEKITKIYDVLISKRN